MMALIHRALRIGLSAAAVFAVVAVAVPVVAIAQEQLDIASFAASEKPPSFADPAAAVDAFKTALAGDDIAALAKLVGLDGAKLKADQNATDIFEQIRDLAAKQLIVQDVEDRKILN